MGGGAGRNQLSEMVDGNDMTSEEIISSDRIDEKSDEEDSS